MTTTETNHAPAMPSWIDFDVIVPRELREEASELAVSFGIILDDLRPFVARFDALEKAISAATDHAVTELQLVGVREGSSESSSVEEAMRILINAVVGWEDTFRGAVEITKLFDGMV